MPLPLEIRRAMLKSRAEQDERNAAAESQAAEAQKAAFGPPENKAGGKAKKPAPAAPTE